MSVTRYGINAQGVFTNLTDGGYVSYQDYEKLAAENAGLKGAALDEIEVINRGGQAYCVKDGMSVNPIYARGWNDYRAKSLSVETTATDAFLAEVLALLDELEAKDKRIADQCGIIQSARKFISDYAGLGDVGAAEFIKIIDRAAMLQGKNDQ